MLIVFSCAGTGVGAALRLRNAERLWRAWTMFLERLLSRLRYTALPIQELMTLVETADLQSLSWLSEWDPNDPVLTLPSSLCDEEYAFARSLFDHLGKTDLDGQLTHFGLHVEEARARAAAAREQCQRRGKAYAVTGICAGLCVGLLLI